MTNNIAYPRSMELIYYGIIFLLTIWKCDAAASSDYPCYDDSWKYSQLSGKCYLISTTKATWSDAQSDCQQKLSTMPEMVGKVNLPAILNSNQAKGLGIVLLNQNNYEIQWTGFQRADSTSPYVYANGTELQWQQSLQNPNFGTEDCVSFTHIVENNGFWVPYYSLQTENCTKIRGYVCEHDAIRCPEPSPDNLNGYNTESMTLFPDSTTVYSDVEVVCKPGFYHYSKLSYATTLSPNSASAAKAKCNGTADSTRNPAKYDAKWKPEFSSTLETCLPVFCSIMDGTLNNVESQPQKNGGSNKFAYGYEFSANCTLGYVNYLDTTKTHASMSCGQDPDDKAKGVWIPEDYNACIGVRCNKTEMEEIVPQDGKLSKAQHKMTRRIYKDFEINQFNQYDNIVYIRCATGYFFPDRSFEKRIICGLKPGSKTEGEWYGYQETILPIPKICQPVQCSYENVIVKDDMNIRKEFIIRYPNGLTKNVTEHDGTDYAFNVQLQFFCKDNFDTVNIEQDVNITCGAEGKWVPQLTACIRRTDKLETGNKKHFVPPAEEAPAAKEVGALVIVILVVFLVLIIILDLSTLARDIKIMGNNIKQLKKRMAKKKT